MVSDHATYLGVFKRIQAGDEDLIKRPLGKDGRITWIMMILDCLQNLLKV